MARSIDTIQAEIIATKNAQPELAALNSASKRSIWQLWTYITATCIAILEQLLDVFISNVETQVAASAAASALWVQSKMFAFQYDATTPQIVQLINTVPQYPVVDATKRIITACSVTSDISNVVNIKVAKSNPLAALSLLEKSSAQGYINTIGIAGINYNVISLNPDKIYIDASIYYQGQYAAIIQTSVIDTLTAYLQNLSTINFDGSLKISDLEAVIRNVAGVNDVVLNNVRGREDAVLFAAGIDLVLNTAIIQRQWKTVAGYIVQETTSGKTFADSLTFIAQ
jgi:hypothetical protein